MEKEQSWGHSVIFLLGCFGCIKLEAEGELAYKTFFFLLSGYVHSVLVWRTVLFFSATYLLKSCVTWIANGWFI